MLDLSDAFVVPPGAIELRAFTHGLMPKRVPAMMERFVHDWQTRGVDAWNEVPNHWRPSSGERVGWWTLPTYLGDHFIAPLLGAPVGTCIMQPNVHWTVQCLLSAPEIAEAGSTLVVTANEFPSVLHSARQWADLLGMKLIVVPADDDGWVDRQAVLDAINNDTALVVLSHVGFTTGERLPDDFVRQVANQAHTHGALLALDGYHATGSMPIGVEALDVDVYFGGLLKEASGSSGNAYVYLRPGLSLTPRLTGWFGDAEPFAFNAVPHAHPDARQRFLSGTSAVASMYHAVEGVRILLDAGLDQVRADSLAKTAYGIQRAEAAGLSLRSPGEAERRGAMIILDVEAADRLCAYLKQQQIFTDSRQGRYLRLAPFVWNTRDDLTRTFDAIAESVDTGAYLDTNSALESEAAGPVT